MDSSDQSPGQSPLVLVTRDLEKTFEEEQNRVCVLRGVNLTVRRGEFLTVMGPSGSGKTTLLTLLGGIDVPTRGQVLLEGEDISALDDDRLSQVRRQKIGFVFQSFNLLPILTAEANISLPLLLAGRSRREALARSDELLHRLGISHRRHHLPGALSGGEQQRVAICRALAAGPPILLADEPTGNLDSVNGAALISLLRKLVDEGQTLVMVTHDANAAAHSDRVIIFRDGAIHAEMPRSQITADNLTAHLRASHP